MSATLSTVIKTSASKKKVEALMDWRDIPLDKTPTEVLQEWVNLGSRSKQRRKRS